MSQTNTQANNGQNRNQNSGRGRWSQEGLGGGGRSDCRDNRRNKLITKYAFEGEMKDGPISKLTITKTGHRPSQFKKISDALPVLCADKNYQGLDEVLCIGHDPVKTDFMPDYPDANLWSTTHHVQVSIVDPDNDPDDVTGERPVCYQMIEQTQVTEANL